MCDGKSRKNFKIHKWNIYCLMKMENIMIENLIGIICSGLVDIVMELKIKRNIRKG